MALVIPACGGDGPEGGEATPSDGTSDGTSIDGVASKTATLEVHVFGLVSGTHDRVPLNIGLVIRAEGPSYGYSETSPAVMQDLSLGKYSIIVEADDHNDYVTELDLTKAGEALVHEVELTPFGYVDPEAPVELGEYLYEYFKNGAHQAEYDDVLSIFYSSKDKVYTFKMKGYPNFLSDGCRETDVAGELDCGHSYDTAEVTATCAVSSSQDYFDCEYTSKVYNSEGKFLFESTGNVVHMTLQ